MEELIFTGLMTEVEDMPKFFALEPEGSFLKLLLKIY